VFGVEQDTEGGEPLHGAAMPCKGLKMVSVRAAIKTNIFKSLNAITLSKCSVDRI
jgi:hypothetical protein